MEELEKDQEELEDIEYSIDQLDGIINILKKHKEDCSDVIEGLKKHKQCLEYTANELTNEIDEINSNLMAEHYNEVIAMNYEFERSRL